MITMSTYHFLTDANMSSSSSSLEDLAEEIDDECQYESMEYLQEKFFLVVVFGGTLCLIGLIVNVILLRLLTKTDWQDSYCIYLVVLACVDLVILLTYILIMCVEILYDYFNSVLLYRLWLLYVPYLFTVSRIVTMTAAYLVLVCSTERYLSVLRFCNKFIQERMDRQKRRVIILLVVLFAVSFRLVSFWEIEVVRNENCTGFSEYQLIQTSLARNKRYQKIYNLAMVQTVQTFFPFFGLVVVNFLIISQWNEIVRKGSTAIYRKTSLYEKFGTSTKGLCTARRTMIALISSYLLCNFLNVLITIWEDLDRNYLSRHFKFYTTVADLVTISTVFCSATRLPLYYACNWKVRKQLETLCSHCNVNLVKKFTRISTKQENMPLKCINDKTDDYRSRTELTKTRMDVNGWFPHSETFSSDSTID